MSQSEAYQHKVRFVKATYHMEATVLGQVEPSTKRRKGFSPIPQMPPKFCSYSTNGDGFLCLHGATVIRDKYGTFILSQFISSLHLYSAWKKQYDSVLSILPYQSDIDRIIIEAEKMMSSGQNVSISVALDPSRGRPIKILEKDWGLGMNEGQIHPN